MSSSNQNQDISRQLTQLTNVLNKLAESLDGGSRSRPGASAGAGAGRAAKGGAASLDLTAKSIKELNAHLKEVDKTLDKLNTGAADVTHTHRDLYKAQSDLIKTTVSGGKKTEAQQQKLLEQINNNIKGHSILGKSLTDAAKSAEEFNQMAERTGEFLAKYSETLKKAGHSALSNITDADELSKALHKLQSEMDLGAEVQELIRKKDFAAAAKKIDADAKNAVVIRNDIKRTSQSFNNLVNVTNGLKTGFSKATDAIGLGFVKDIVTLGGSAALIFEGAKEAYNQFKTTASAGFGAEFIKLSGTAIKLGISLEALTKITKENMTLIGRTGLQGFTDSLKQSQIQLMKLGLTTEEAAKTRALINENAFLTGVDISNKKALNASSDQQIKVYEDLRSVTGESIEVLAQQTKSILQSNDSMKLMAVLNKSQRVQMLQDINLERARLTTMGLSNDAAIEVIKTVQSLKNEKTTTRLDQSAKIQAAGAATGMDAAETDKIAQIMLKSKGSRSAEDDKALTDYSRKITQASAKQFQGQGAGIGDQLVGDYVDDLLGPIKDLGEKQNGANLDRGLTEEQKSANKAMGRVPAAVAETSAKIESGFQLIHSPLLKIAAGVVGILGWLALRAYKKSKGEGKPESILDKIPGLAGFGKKDKEPGLTDRTRPGKLPGEHPMKIVVACCDDDHKMGRGGKGRESTGANGPKSTYHDTPEKGAKPGKSVQGRRKFQALESAAEGPSGFGRLSQVENKVKGAGLESLGSDRLQQRIAANRKAVAARVPLDAIPGPQRIDLPQNNLPKSKLGKVTGGIGKIAGKGMGLLTEGVGKIASLGAKAIPFLGIAVAAVEGIMGAFEGVGKAAEIFGVDVNKQALTTSQKVSAGIAGALSTISFGLIPLDSTARLLNDVAEDGVAVLTDYWEEGMEFFYNKAVPAIWDGFKSVLGFIGGAIVDVLSPKTWISVFTGEGGNGGIVQSILSSLWHGIEFMAVALTKGVVKFGADIMDKITGMLPKFLVPEALQNLGAKNTWASSDTHMSDFDTPEQSAARQVRKDKRAKRDKADKGESGPGAVQGTASSGNDGTQPPKPVQGTSSNDGPDTIGLVNSYNAQLSDDQLRAQGIQATPTEGNQAGAVTANKSTPNQKDEHGTTVNNTTNNTTAEPVKTKSETILSDISDKLTTLVELQTKELNMKEDLMKLSSTASRLSGGKGDGYSPSIQSFMNGMLS